MENTNSNPGDIFPLTFCLHTYINVPDVTKCQLLGAFKGTVSIVRASGGGGGVIV